MTPVTHPSTCTISQAQPILRSALAPPKSPIEWTRPSAPFIHAGTSTQVAAGSGGGDVPVTQPAAAPPARGGLGVYLIQWWGWCALDTHRKSSPPGVPLPAPRFHICRDEISEERAGGVYAEPVARMLLTPGPLTTGPWGSLSKRMKWKVGEKVSQELEQRIGQRATDFPYFKHPGKPLASPRSLNARSARPPLAGTKIVSVQRCWGS
jgi:hypothetical protein